MKKMLLNTCYCTVSLLLLAASGRAGESVNENANMPAILAELGGNSTKPLDDGAAREIRGEAKYAMVKLNINILDYFGGSGASWTVNPWAWCYGNWGGATWSDGKAQSSVTGGTAVCVDAMDRLFKAHDNSLASGVSSSTANQRLRDGLAALPNAYSSTWGSTFVSAPAGAPASVYVSSATALNLGWKIYLGYKPMVFSDYARRQATTAFAALKLVRL